MEILKVIKKKDINQYINKDNCLASWGGNDNYQFSFVPENKVLPQANGNLLNGNTTINIDEQNNNSNDKKVRYIFSTNFSVSLKNL